MIERLSVGKVTLQVKHLQKMELFYQTVLGLKVRHRDDESVTLGTSRLDLVRLISSPKSIPPGVRSVGLFHLAILLPTRQDLGAWFRHFRAQSPEVRSLFEGPGDHGVSEALYLHDPEGNGIEVYADRPREVWPTDAHGNIQMYTMGIDLEELLADAQTHGWNEIPEETKMGHVHLKVSDLQASHRFYVDQLGLDLMLDFGDSAKFISKNGYHHHIGMNTWNSRNAGPLSRDALGLSDTEFVVRLKQPENKPSVERLFDLSQSLSAKGVKIVETSSNVIRLLDPDYLQVTLRVEGSE